jgi:hypothetical protein
VNVRKESQLRLDMLLAQVRKTGVKPEVLALSQYEDEATFNFLLPHAGWTFKEWQAVNEYCAGELTKRGFIVGFVPVRLPNYYDFLTRYHLSNTRENRAQFVAWTLAPKPKPDPITYAESNR